VIPAGCFVAAATPDDVAELLVLERLCFTHPWSGRHFADSMADPPRGRVLVVRRAAGRERPAIVAYCVVLLAGGELQVYNLAVHPSLRGVGLGRWLMEMVLERGRRQGAQAALLEVRRGNQAARHLYESLGFTLLSTRRDYYHDPVEDALVMERQLP
jgi:[ribosomal protein S18]-alanine N-acetyltransferase